MPLELSLRHFATDAEFAGAILGDRRGDGTASPHSLRGVFPFTWANCPGGRPAWQGEVHSSILFASASPAATAPTRTFDEDVRPRRCRERAETPPNDINCLRRININSPLTTSLENAPN